MTRRRRTAHLAAVLAVAGAFLTASLASGATSVRTAAPCTNTSQLLTWKLPALIRLGIVIPVAAPSISAAQIYAQDGFGGILIFGATGAKNFHAYVKLLRSEVPNDAGLLVMTDDEGGGVWRLSNLVPPLPWARQMSADTTTEITQMATTAAQEMVKVGISMDLAPVLDIDGTNAWPSATNADGYRSFSGSEKVVSKDAVAFMKGLIAGGVLPVIKHFPGLGGVSPNTDDGPASTKPWSTVQTTSLLPFRAAIAAGAPAMMISNATIPGLTTLPASVSAAVYNYVRNTMHFTGLLMTDSLSAGSLSAAHLSVAAASALAIDAGSDMVLFGIPTTGSTLSLANNIEQQIFNSVSDGLVKRSTVFANALQILTAQKANLCAGLS